MDQTALRNFKDFLQVYNYLSHSCFQRCVNDLNSRDLTQDEARCVELCARKHINVNHKIMAVFMEVQPLIVNKRIEDMNEEARLVEQQQRDLSATSSQEPVQPQTVAATSS